MKQKSVNEFVSLVSLFWSHTSHCEICDLFECWSEIEIARATCIETKNQHSHWVQPGRIIYFCSINGNNNKNAVKNSLTLINNKLNESALTNQMCTNNQTTAIQKKANTMTKNNNNIEICKHFASPFKIALKPIENGYQLLDQFTQRLNWCD